MRRYHVTTFGCQMNAHDSERIKGCSRSSGSARPSIPTRRTSSSSTRARSARSPTSASRPTWGTPPGASANGRRRSSPSAAATPRRNESASSTSTRDVDVAFGPGSISHLGTGSVPAAKASRVAASALRRARVRRGAPDASRAALPGVGAGLDGLQLRLLVLHRPRRARARDLPPARRDPRRGRAAREGGRQRGHSPRPERQLVRP